MFHKNETHLLYGRRVTSRRPPQPELVVVLRGVWRLVPGQPLQPIGDTIEQGPLRAETCAPEDLERTGALTYPGDFAEWKPTAEVMLKGTCHPPGGQPVTACPVRFQVGAWEKTLACVGPRAWIPGLLYGATPSEPQPFLRMPLTWENALGGRASSANPVGKGIGDDLLPTVEYPAQLVTSRAQRPRPASFMPVNALWTPRADRQGRKYGAAWRKERAPFHSEDFDWRHCCSAPDDQLLPHYLRGDEDVVFQHLHPQHPTWTTKLPGIRPRHFVKDKAGTNPREVPLALDTLWADLEEGRLYLTWRGLTPIGTLDMSDVGVSLTALEMPDAPPRPLEEYLARLQKHEDDPIGFAESVPPDLLPLFLREAAPEMARERVLLGLPPPPAPPPEPVLPPPTNPLSALLREKLGSARPEQQAQVQAALDRALALDEAMPGLPRQGPSLAEKLAESVEKLRKAPAPIPLAPGAMIAPDGTMPRPRIDLRAAAEGLKKAKEGLRRQKLAAPDLAAIEALLVLPPSELTPPLGEEEEEGEDLRDQDLSGQDLRQRRLRGARLQGANLAGAELSGADLTGADLTGANLEGANLAGATLRHATLARARAAGVDLTVAQLEGAVLFEADLSRAKLRKARLTFAVGGKTRLEGADLRGADLTMAAFPGADLSLASLREACLEMTTLEGCDLQKTDFRQAKGKMTLLARSDLREARLRGADLERADFERCDLREADLVGAQLHMASFRGAQAQGARFSGARLTQAVATRGADFTGATLDRIQGKESVWQDANLTGADFSFADLRQAALQGARCDVTRFDAAELSDAQMRKLQGEGTRFVRANLCRAALVEARLTKAELLGANMWRTVLLKAELIECDLREANVAGAIRGDA